MLYNSELTPQGSSLHPTDSAGLLNLGMHTMPLPSVTLCIDSRTHATSFHGLQSVPMELVHT